MQRRKQIHDPHVWVDPALAREEVALIQAAFLEADPDNKDDYRRMAEALSLN